MPIWQWADKNVMLQNEDAAEPGAYRSSKTPWTRRLQEIMRRPFMWAWHYEKQTYVRVPVTEVNVQKSSQSGFSEACLNGIRWAVTYRPRNTIYSIDSADEAKKIARRLLRSFKFLDQSIFTGDPDDLKSLEFKLRGMELLFYGSFSTGKFANKQAPLTISDEVEEHGKFILDDLASRKKTSTGGLQVNLSKPKLKGGPINRAFNDGNQEEFFVPCPHCGQYQFLTFFPEERDVPFAEFKGPDDLLQMDDGHYMPRPLPLGERRRMKTGRFVFEHCKNLLGQYDRLRVQTDTYYECAACLEPIRDSHKRWMIDRGIWLPMELAGSPGIVSQQMSDFYSEDELSSIGKLADEYLRARDSGYERLQGFWNHRAGKPWSEEANATEEKDITRNIAGKTLWFVDGPNSRGQPVRLIFEDAGSAQRQVDSHVARGVKSEAIISICPPYRRGTIPWKPRCCVLGSDVGGTYARWIALALHQNLFDLALVDWGEELDPDDIRHIIQTARWKIIGTDLEIPIHLGFQDARYRTRDVYAAALSSQNRLVPCMGIGGAAAKSLKLWSHNQIPSYPRKLKRLDYNDQRAKDGLYLDRIKRMRRRLWFPCDIEEHPDFIAELCNERQKQDKNGNWFWPDETEGPNHWADCIKDACTGVDFLTRSLTTPKTS